MLLMVLASVELRVLNNENALPRLVLTADIWASEIFLGAFLLLEIIKIPFAVRCEVGNGNNVSVTATISGAVY